MKRGLFNSYSLLATLLMLVTLASHSALRIEITQGIDGALPIAIIPFKAANPRHFAMSSEINSIIASDLKRSGKISPIEQSRFPEYPKDSNQINYPAWRKLGTESMLIGQIKPSQDTFTSVNSASYYELNIQLIDTVKGAKKLGSIDNGELIIRSDHLIMAKTYRFKANEIRKLAHQVSDDIYEKLTGERGAFSTRILYVLVERNLLKKPEYRLELADSDGHNAQTLLVSKEPIMSPAWSPQGDKIAYVSFEKGKPEIFIQHLLSGQRTVVTSYPGINGAPAWSPDGRKLALVLSKDGNPEIYELNLSNNKLSRITRHYAIDTEPQWSPDGKSLLFTSDRGGKPQIYRYDLKSRKLNRLTFRGGYNARARFTPDGERIIMVHREHGQFHIAKMNLSNGRLEVLTKTSLDESPSVAPNGSMVIYGTNYRGKGVLSAVSIDGRVKLRLPALQGEVREPAWSPFLN